MCEYILGIDPGNKESAFCLCDAVTLKPLFFEKETNERMWNDVFKAAQAVGWDGVHIAIEDVASYGMPIGREVFDTVKWIARMQDRLEGFEKDYTLIYRKDEKLAICQSPRANDANIRQALIDRFAPGVPNKGKGTKKEPGWFYGFKADIWQAYAVAVTYYELRRE